MTFDAAFLAASARLAVPVMGTEALAPWLYATARFMRARRVLEAGMGHTTLWLAQAVADNAAAFAAERAALREKAGPYLARVDAMGPEARTPAADAPPPARGLAAVYARKPTALAEARAQWMFDEPGALLDPGYYCTEVPARLTCVDRYTAANSSAPRVRPVLAELGLSGAVHEVEGDFWAIPPATLAPDGVPFDLIWIDVPVGMMNVASLLRGPHWPLLNPDGGVLLIHDMLSHEGGQMLVREVFKAEQQRRFGEFEFLSLLEPQRTVQNSIVAVRRIDGFQPRRIEADYVAPDEGRLEADARALLGDA